jgi:hypothetical protein
MMATSSQTMAAIEFQVGGAAFLQAQKTVLQAR